MTLAFPERFSNLPDYAFPRLRALLAGIAPGGPERKMTIGEPKHPFPHWVPDVIAQNSQGFGSYPPNNGAPELLNAIANWIDRRYGVTRDPETELMTLNGTREGLFNAALALSPETKAGKKPVVLMPNPFYQVYMVAALTAGADPVFLPADKDTGFLPDFESVPAEVLDRTTIAYICSPANPQGAIASREYWKTLLGLAETHDFRVFADECYSEIYRAAPPCGAMEVAKEIGANPERIVVFNSLSKRSNLPGLRSGFVASGPRNMAAIRQLRAYAGAPMPLPLQRVAERAWADETHVDASRAMYIEKFDLADEVFADIDDAAAPEGGFFMWLPVRDSEQATIKLWRETGVQVLPGAYLSRDVNGKNPGAKYIRVALVAPKQETQDALIQLRDCLYN